MGLGVEEVSIVLDGFHYIFVGGFFFGTLLTSLWASLSSIARSWSHQAWFCGGG